VVEQARLGSYEHSRMVAPGLAGLPSVERLSEVPMVDLILTEREQSALRTLTASEPVPGTPFPTTKVLEAVLTLLPSDEIAVARADDTGRVEDLVTLGGPDQAERDPQVCDGPLMVGLVHVRRMPDLEPDLSSWGYADLLWLGYRNGARHVVQLVLGRYRQRFGSRDLAMLGLGAPSLQRVMRERPTPQLPAALTVQERRVLMRVAAGHSNAHIAESLGVTAATVRKHLEHAYRKLGVTSRVAAVARLQGRDHGDLDLRERLERFA
jgi:DNA-binding CsgD family transcriptional regulator